MSTDFTVCVCVWVCECVYAREYRAGDDREAEDTRVCALLSVPLGAKENNNNLATIVSEPHVYKS